MEMLEIIQSAIDRGWNISFRNDVLNTGHGYCVKICYTANLNKIKIKCPPNGFDNSVLAMEDLAEKIKLKKIELCLLYDDAVNMM